MTDLMRRLCAWGVNLGAFDEAAWYTFIMRHRSSKPDRTSTVRNMSVKARSAAKAFKGLKAAATPAKLRGRKARAIERAVREYYLG
jgi:hypothetical protein